jgi:hypothetical protein
MRNIQVDVEKPHGRETTATVSLKSSSKEISKTMSKPGQLVEHSSRDASLANWIVENLSIWASDVVEGAFFGPYDEPRQTSHASTN